jgi:hypothetical protein
MTPAFTVLEDWIAVLGRRWPVPRAPKEVSSALGVDLLLGSDASLAAGSSSRHAGGIIDAIRRARAKDGLFLPGPPPTIFLAHPRTADAAEMAPRQRFTWAHELGHYLLWKGTPATTGADYWEEEAACNWFAGEFLAPRALVQEIVGRPSKEWLTAVRRVADACDVSWDVAAGCMTALSGGRIVFLRLSHTSPRDGVERMRVVATSTYHHSGIAVGARAIIADAQFMRTCAALRSSETHLTTMQGNIGGLQTDGCPVLVRRLGPHWVLMVRVASLPAREGKGR